jgi:hypothetical protein
VPWGLLDPIGIWEFTPGPGLSFETAELLFRYDDLMASALGLDETALRLYRSSGGAWYSVAASLDTVNKWMLSQPLSSFSIFAIAAENENLIPEPASATLLFFSTLALLRRRRRK